jgi:uncharacterized protein YbgA (DUF1722 family)
MQKMQLTRDEKQLLLEVLDRYRKKYVPLIVPITPVGHYVRKYHEPHIEIQHYLTPHPVELKLRNRI